VSRFERQEFARCFLADRTTLSTRQNFASPLAILSLFPSCGAFFYSSLSMIPKPFLPSLASLRDFPAIRFILCDAFRAPRFFRFLLSAFALISRTVSPLFFLLRPRCFDPARASRANDESFPYRFYPFFFDSFCYLPSFFGRGRPLLHVTFSPDQGFPFPPSHLEETPGGGWLPTLLPSFFGSEGSDPIPP